MHIYDGRDRAQDEEGFEATDLAKAQMEARRLIRGLIASQLEEGKGPDGQYVDLRDESDRVVDVIAFKDVYREG